MDRPELKPGGVIYPETDGKPMAETDRHRELMFDLLSAARYHFRDADDVYTSGNLLVYFVEGDPTRCVSPDFFTVRGVGKGERRVWKVWEEGKAPEVVIELTSTKTHREDLGEKRAVYEMLGVLEYFLFDPEGAHFQPQLRGFRLREGEFRPLPVERAPDGGLVLESAVLGLRLWGKGGTLRLVDPVSGEKVPVLEDFFRSNEEERARAERAERHAEDEKARAEREKARAEEERRRAEEERRHAEEERRHAEEERRHAEEERRRAEEEKSRADGAKLQVEAERAERERERARAERAEGELAELRERLERLGRRDGPDRPDRFGGDPEG